MQDTSLATLWSTLLDRLDNPLKFLASGEERIYWIYLAWGMLIALFFFSRAAPGKVSLLTFLRFAFPKSVYWSRSAKVDYGWFLLVRPICGLLFLPALAVVAPTVSEWTQRGLRAGVPALQDSLPSTLPTVIVFTIVSILVADFAGFFAHWLQHRVGILWEFHKVHHSAETLTPITVYRMHPVDDLLVLLLGALALSTTSSLFQFMAIGPLATVSVFGMNIFTCAFLLFGANLRHTHLWVDYGPKVSRVLISPAQHQIHHSEEARHHDRNMGFIFAFWDRLFGTLYVPRGREEIRFGLGGGEEREFSDPLKLFWLPFAKLARGTRLSTVGAGVSIGVIMLGLTVAGAQGIASETAVPSLRLEDLTWTEVEARLARGYRSVIVPTAGHEQNGPHVVLGKHHYVVQYAADRIARELGNALVAPVITYAPEGSIEPREGHMRFAGTISLPTEVFEAILESTARSLRAHGFRTICFIGDSGDNQASQARVAERLNAEWQGEPTRVLHVNRYYDGNGQLDWLERNGIPAEEVGTHAGVRDTSELLFVHPEGVRGDRLFESAHDGSRGVSGDPTRASEEIGQQMIELKVRAAVDQIRAETAPPAS